MKQSNDVAFTPGPWGYLERSVFDARGGRIAYTEWRGMGGAVANACLMATAPEMYTALKEMRSVMAKCVDDCAGMPTEEFFKSKVRHCDLVLAKADGRL